VQHGGVNSEQFAYINTVCHWQLCPEIQPMPLKTIYLWSTLLSSDNSGKAEKKAVQQWGNCHGFYPKTAQKKSKQQHIVP